MKKQVFFVLLLILTSLLCFAQEGMESTLSDISLSSASERLPPITYNRLLLAMSNPEYPVMPGDVYKLTYLSSHQLVSMEVIVASDYIVNLAVFGKINAKNMTFNKIKSIVEQKVEQAYPGSTPSLALISVGSFQVYITGEVKQSVNITAWGLTLLSEVVGQHLTPYSSNRDIEILSEDGSGRQYDLFKASRFGMQEEDPYLKPGDTIIVAKRDRAVRISGEVRRPGQYQLLPGEGLKELIQYYGDAFTELANRRSVRIDRLVTGSERPAETLYIDLSKGYDDKILLKDLDFITVPAKIDKLPVVYFEGALGKGLESEGGQAETSNKVTYRFKEGETLYSALLTMEDSLSPVADLANSFIARLGQAEIIPVNMERLLYDYNVADDIELKPYDLITIPFKQFFVIVSGAVISPGRYPFVPNRTYEYYVNLAGGIDPDKNTNRKVVIRDIEEVLRTTEAVIQPEDRIYVPANSFFYKFNRYAPVISTVLALGISIMNVFLLMGN